MAMNPKTLDFSTSSEFLKGTGIGDQDWYETLCNRSYAFSAWLPRRYLAIDLPGQFFKLQLLFPCELLDSRHSLVVAFLGLGL
jgi:hypothetical protein